ncbi:MMPL family transporter [Actinomadura barringtoniae]|uniref:MMPL family transporter n=1 Tax=Actinomadura barringtoniae TaxID=1427535 RepID=A0A939PHP6_9ACTN|nr:MMPL family transporter [Actinomadura barringtoniae]MBO2452891.1 MMPL family transporter [Actinomadura barringtoniae]
MLAGLGRLIHRRRWISLALILVTTVLAGAWGLGVFARFSTEGGFDDPKSSSSLVARLGATYFGSTNPDVLVLYRSDTMTVDDPRYEQAVIGTVARLPKDKVAELASYWSFDEKDAAPLASRDKHATFVSVKLAGKDDAAKAENYKAIKDRLNAPGLQTRLGGNVPLGQEFATQVVADIVNAETISMPILLILLVLVFGALTASVLPLIVALFSIVGGLAVLHMVTYLTDVTSMALEVVTMMGVGLAIDYSLFIVSRFREELAKGMDARGISPGKPWKQAGTRRDRKAEKRAYLRALKPVRQSALAHTMATAGRTIMVSGITVSAALSGLLVFPQMFLRTIGLAGICTVLVAVFGAIVLLPTMLALLGTKVEFGRMPWRRPNSRRVRKARRDPDSGFWHALGHSVMKHPFPYFVVVIGILGVLFVPFLNVQFGSVDARILPKDSPTRAVVETVKRDFPNGSAEPIDVVISGDLIPRNWRPVRKGDNIPPYLEQFRKKLAAMPGVTDAKYTGYSGDYGGVRISVTHKWEPMDEHAQDLVKEIRGMSLTKNGYPMHIDVGGSTAAQMDLMSSLMRSLPKMAVIVGLATFFLLFMFFGSIVLPLKAIVMNVLSIGASFGVIVWGFQYGHLAGILNFTPTGGVEATSMILILAVVFGLSMDYEVFLLSRIREEWDKHRDNRAAVARGMQHTGSIITSAALLFLVVIAAFGMAGITSVKLIGVGMFVAVVVDAALVRSLLVPATMRFMGNANWWLPGPLAGLHSRMDLREREDMPSRHIIAPSRLPEEQPYPYAMQWEEAGPDEEEVPSAFRTTANGRHAAPAAPAPAAPAPFASAPTSAFPENIQFQPGAAAPGPHQRPSQPYPQQAQPYPQPQPNGNGAQPGFDRRPNDGRFLPTGGHHPPAPGAPNVPPATISQRFPDRPEAPSRAPRAMTRPPTSADHPMQPSATSPRAPWAPWSNGQPQPSPTHTTRTKREIVPNPDGSGWRWSTVEDNDVD